MYALDRHIQITRPDPCYERYRGRRWSVRGPHAIQIQFAVVGVRASQAALFDPSPRCGTPIEAVVSSGPLEHVATPCGCPAPGDVLESVARVQSDAGTD